MRYRIVFWLIGFILLFLGSELNGQEKEGINIGGPLRDAGSSIILDQRGDLVICGTTRSYGNGGDDMMLVKIDLEEGVQFQKTYKWTHHERAWCIEETTDGDYVVFGELWDWGYGREDMFLMKVDENGDKLWEQYYGGYHTDQGFSVKSLDDGFIALGYTSSQPETTRGNFYLVRTDLSGNKLWENNYGTEFLDFGFCVLPDASGDFWLLGTAGGFFNPARADYMNHDADMLLIKTDSYGTEIFRSFIGGMLHDWGSDMIPTDDGGLLLFGSTQSQGSGSFDMFLVKVDQNGNKIWEKTYGGSDFEYGSSIAIDPAGDLYLLGSKQQAGSDSGPDIFVVKTSPEGVVIWEQSIGGSGSDYGHDLVSLPDSGCVIVGEIQNVETNDTDIYVVRLDKFGRIMGLDVPPDILNPNAIKFFPNPVSDMATLEWEGLPPPDGFNLKVFSLSGQLLQDVHYSSEKMVQIELGHLPAGTYLYQVLSVDRNLSGKFMTR